MIDDLDIVGNRTPLTDLTTVRDFLGSKRKAPEIGTWSYSGLACEQCDSELLEECCYLTCPPKNKYICSGCNRQFIF